MKCCDISSRIILEHFPALYRKHGAPLPKALEALAVLLWPIDSSDFCQQCRLVVSDKVGKLACSSVRARIGDRESWGLAVLSMCKFNVLECIPDGVGVCGLKGPLARV